MSALEEKTGIPEPIVHAEHRGDVDVIETIHKDGTVDYVDTQAIGGELDEMPDGYFYSIQFIGTVIVRTSVFTSVENLITMYSIGCLLCQYVCLPRMGLARQHLVSLLHLYDAEWKAITYTNHMIDS